MGESEYQKVFSKNLKKYMSINNKTQIDLINDLGFNKSAVSTWVNGTRLPRMDKINMLAEYFGIKRSDLIEDKTEKRDTGIRNRIPVLGRVAAGIPIDAIENIIDYEEVSDKIASIGELFGLQIRGNSMTPRICDKDVVIVKKQNTAESGDIVIATINGDDAVCKRLMVYGDTILLRSNNPEYDDIDVTGRPDFQIIGKVVELRGKF